MRYEVPFISQFEGITDPAWQWRGCGVVALKMVMDYWHGLDSRNGTMPLAALVERGIQAGAYREGVGWTHAGLVVLARSLGYDAFNRDRAAKGPTPMEPGTAFLELTDELKKGPLLASVWSGLEPGRGGGHIVVVTGAENGLVFFNDPEQQTAREGVRVLARGALLRAFKSRYIAVRP